MSNEGRARENGYRAFISYSHRDDAAAKSLHKRLETYRLPKKLIGQSGERGPITERLTPIFRDLDELSAADDLTVEIKAALARSATLIVLCSPGAKASKWVNLEIETFRALHGNTRPVLAALIEGEPADAFPPALIANGQEPVAADFRKNRDGKSLALLKLVAGMAGAPLDALVQRDAQRQYRRVMAITGTALTAALAMALLLVVALRAQSEAERQRQEAEGLVEYMLTDLRDKLKGDIGKLRVMAAVNERAMKYYAKQGQLDKLSVDSINRRARILHAMGEDDDLQGNIVKAETKFIEANRYTLNSTTRSPDSPQTMFAHGQSQYWMGYIEYRKNKKLKTLIYFTNQHNIARNLFIKYPKSPEFANEFGTSSTNICAILLELKIKNELALLYCKIAVEATKKSIELNPNNINTILSLINRHAWLSDAYIANNLLKKSIEQRDQQIFIIKNTKLKWPNDFRFLEQEGLYHISMNDMCNKFKIKGNCNVYKRNSINIFNELIKNDPNNQEFINRLKLLN